MRSLDFAQVANIAYQTGYFGDPAQIFFPDPALFGDLWIGPYLHKSGLERGTLGLVAVQVGAEGSAEILGYIVGMTYPAQYQQALSSEVVRVLGKLATGRYPRWRGCVAYLARALFYPGPHLDGGAYPAHLHLNLLPQARGQGLGGRLLDSYLGVLRLGGIRGVQLSTTLENRSALALYQKRGFMVRAQRISNLWQPWLGRPVTRVAMGLNLGALPDSGSQPFQPHG